MKVLCVAAHPDDEVLGCGATLARHVLFGDEVHVLILGRGRPGGNGEAMAKAAGKVIGYAPLILDLPDNQFDTVPLLSIVQMVERETLVWQPEVVYTHSDSDLNVDHRLTNAAVLTASRPGGSVKRILSFEMPSSTECGLEAFWPNVFVEVTGEPMWRKQQALECYAEEMRSGPHPRSYAAVNALAVWRGASVSVPVAEAFVSYREVR